MFNIAYKTKDSYVYREVSEEIFNKFENLCIYGIIKSYEKEVGDMYLHVVSRETYKLFFHLVDNGVDF